MPTHLDDLIGSSSSSQTIEPSPTLLDKFCAKVEQLQAMGGEPKSPTTLDYFSVGMQQAGLRGGAGIAVLGALKPEGKNDRESLSIAGLLMAEPAAAAVGYAAMQLGADKLGDKSMGALKVGAAIAGAAAGGAPIMAAAAIVDGGCQLYREHSLDRPAPGQPLAAEPGAGQAPAIQNYSPTPEEELDYDASMTELGWGPK
jgi:hypothetical protein